jgi:anti-sigma B factor antagonist
VAIVSITGKVTAGPAADSLRKGLLDLFAQGHKRIVVNLSEITMLDSAGLGELVSAYSSITRDGGAMKLACGNHRVASLLRLTRLDSLFDAFDDEQSAIRSFGARSNSAQRQKLDEFLD